MERNQSAANERIDDNSPVTNHKTGAESEYWTNFYESHEFLRGSSFSEFIKEQKHIPSKILDFGCGDGRDSFSFARSGKYVLGLDRSPEGVKHGNQRAIEAALTESLSFQVCDVSNTGNVERTIESFRPDNNPVLFYARFFLHSIPEDVQASLLETLSKCAHPGDVFAAEFRTDKDEDLTKIFGVDHYRRYQNAEVFSHTLKDKYGWEIGFEEESRGLAPYKNEDPYIYRVVAAK